MERLVVVSNAKGLHARSASRLVEVAKAFVAEITLHREGISANAKSIIGLMLLEATPGTELLVRAEGADAERALAAIEELFRTGFGE
jgi:phosphotransferase system HPr (HPr) family protein